MDPANPKTLFPSTSAVTYWQIELQEGPVQGTSLLKTCRKTQDHNSLSYTNNSIVFKLKEIEYFVAATELQRIV